MILCLPLINQRIEWYELFFTNRIKKMNHLFDSLMNHTIKPTVTFLMCLDCKWPWCLFLHIEVNPCVHIMINVII
jgi:hypothetical protein